MLFLLKRLTEARLLFRVLFFAYMLYFYDSNNPFDSIWPTVWNKLYTVNKGTALYKGFRQVWGKNGVK